jgi:DNA-binding IclR family transcriptional regulator
MNPGSPATTPEPVSMIDRVAQILEAFDGPVSLTLAQVVARTGLPRSSAHRILEQLVKVRWLAREDHHYHLGLGMLELGSLAGHQNELRGAATVALHELAHRTGMVVHLAVLDGAEIIYLDKVGGRFGVRVPSRIGGRAPAHCTGAGKAMLAFADDGVLRAVAAGPLPTPTAASIRTERALRAELGRVRDRGVAFDREESARGLACVAVPVGPPGSPCAAVSVCGPVARVNSEQLIGPVRATAHAVWSSFAAGRRPPPASLFARPARCAAVGA